MNDIHPVKAPFETPFLPLLLESIGILAFVAVLVWLAMFIHKRYSARKRMSSVAPQISQPPKDYRAEALQKLKELSEIRDEFESREVYFLLNEITREYLENVWRLPLTKMTRAEIEGILFPKVDSEMKKQLAVFLTHCEQGEFSCSSHTKQYLTHTFEYAFAIIRS